MDESTQLGWKFFFAALMLAQVLALGIMWRVLDASTENKTNIARMESIVREGVIPRLEALEKNQ